MTDDDMVDDQPGAQGTLAENLFLQLTEAILAGEMKLGSKISEPLLAQKYGVSRAPLREALHRLQERHLITRSARQGARVVEASPQMLNAIYSVREALEGIAAKEATRLMSDAELAHLRAVVSQYNSDALIEDGPHNALGPHESDFHYLVAQGSRNPLLIELLCDQLYPLLRLYRTRSDTPTLRRKGSIEHMRIVECMEDRDGELAEIIMRRHIAAARVRRLGALESSV